MGLDAYLLNPVCDSNQNVRFENIPIDDLSGLLKAKRTDNSKPYFTVSIEGNIGCGKSTLLKYLEDSANTVECLLEPVDEWCNIQGVNGLDKLYTDPKRWTFTFNSYVMLTRLKMYEKMTTRPVKLLERSLFSNRHVFVANSFASDNLTRAEYGVLSQWFDFMDREYDTSVDLYVYLRADPQICYQRIQQRARTEENEINLSLIEQLHERHEACFIREALVRSPVLVLDASNDLATMRQIWDVNRKHILCGCT